MVDRGIQYSEYLGENLDNSIGYSNYLGENLDKSIDYSKYIAEMVDRGIQYSEYLGENLDNSIGYSEYLGENLDKSIDYSEYLGENLDKSISYSEYLAENLDNSIDYPENLNNYDSNISSAKLYEQSITKKLDRIIKETEDHSNSKLHFMGFLNSSQKDKFNRLSSYEKEQLITEMNNNKVMSTIQANHVWESMFKGTDNKLDFINDMPEKYINKWNNLSEQRKEQIIAESKFYNLSNAYAIKNFWDTRDLRSSQVEMESLNENRLASDITPNRKEISLDDDYVNNIINKVKFNLKR